MHFGLAPEVQAARTAVPADACAAHPERFVLPCTDSAGAAHRGLDQRDREAGADSVVL